jgi:LysR family pca operon transcriptional activator
MLLPGANQGAEVGTHLSRRLKLQHLRIVAAIAEKGSLLKGAAALGLTQPALTRALHEIETIVGSSLFERHVRGTIATPMGQRLVETAQRVLAELKDCERGIDARRGEEHAVVSAGALPAAAVGVVPGAVARLHERAPKVKVRIMQGQTDELLGVLATADLDLVVGRLYMPQVAEQFERTVLYEDAVVVLARESHPIFQERSDPLPLLNRYPMVLPAATRATSAEVDDFVQRFKLQQSIYLESNSFPLIRELLISSNAITIVPRMIFAGDMTRGALKEVAVVPIRGGCPCGIVQRRDASLGPAASLFADALRSYVRELELIAAPRSRRSRAPSSS